MIRRLAAAVGGDVAHAWRAWAKRPVLAVVIVATLALSVLGLEPALGRLPSGYSAEQSAALYERVDDALASLPGVVSSASALVPLLTGNALQTVVRFVGRDAPAQSREGGRDAPISLPSSANFVSPGLLSALGMELLAGRDFVREDDARVAIVR
ncbi:MAG TPA: hypothetical protein VF339_05975 [Gammaproteobacteria bacterium]